MSGYHYATRLYWDRAHGVVNHDGVQVVLRNVPRIPGLGQFEFIDYSPRTNMSRLCPFEGAPRVMSESETIAVMAWLDRMADAARRAVCNCCTYPQDGFERRSLAPRRASDVSDKWDGVERRKS